MGSKAQRRKERHERKRQEKRKKSRERPQFSRPNIQFAVGSNARHRQRLAEQVPHAWAGESPEDVAVFEDAALASLPTEPAQQVTAIRQALEHASASRAEDAVQCVSVIPRNSPLSEWRIFIRGLVDWLADNTEAARETWTRLNPERRPGRIATAMMLSLRSDLEQVSKIARKAESKEAELSDAATAAPLCQWDNQLIDHAHLLRRVRFDRAALRVAQAGLKVPEESPKLLLGPRKLEWIRKFVQEYTETEPELCNALSQSALRRAFTQNFTDLFDEAVSSLPGPRHDRRNLLLIFFFYSQVEDRSSEAKAAKALYQYLDDDLPQNEALSKALRNAIASQIHYFEAMTSMRPEGLGFIESLLAPPENTRAIRAHFRASLEADPRNRSAHKAYAGWLQSKTDDDRLTQARRKPIEAELAEVMRGWSQGLPEDVEPRLWLVDHLLENELLEEARPHVEFLSASRQDDPRVRAMPWKWQVLEAMRLCRRKAWLAEVPARLDEAETLWPAWLPKQWLPYLRAAWLLRVGQWEEMEKQRQQICEASGLTRDSLADACMMLGAAQQMRTPPTDLKQLRAPVDRALGRLDTLSEDELIQTGAFFWDLHRVNLVYPAYRMHGGKIGQALLARWKQGPQVIPDEINEERFHKALLWCSEFRFWSNSNEISLPPFYSDAAIAKHPLFAAASLNAFLKSTYHWRVDKYRELGTLLREAAQSQRDAYYRYWFLALAEQLDEVSAKRSMTRLDNLFGIDDDDFDVDDEDELDDIDDSFDPDCDCPRCQRARRAHEKAKSTRRETRS